MKSIYMDYAATTPLLPEVLEAMLPIYRGLFGNPSSLHSYGRGPRQAMDQARHLIASSLRCESNELYFTSGGTESDNLAIFGTVQLSSEQGHMITSSIEHPAVLQACQRLEASGWDVTYLPVDRYGRVDPQDVERSIRPTTALISVMYGNNETGSLQPIQAIGDLARAYEIPFHVDAVQALGTMDIDLTRLPVDLASFSAHKIGGPKGIGLLYVKRGTAIQPTSYGGAQEYNKRAGTENVAGIVGMAKAIEIADRHKEGTRKKYKELRTSMLAHMQELLAENSWFVHGHAEKTLPHILNISFVGVSTETMLMNLDLAGVAASGGSACSSGSLSVSHVLRAMGTPSDQLESAVRFSFGPETTENEITQVAKKVATIIDRISYIREKA